MQLKQLDAAAEDLVMPFLGPPQCLAHCEELSLFLF